MVEFVKKTQADSFLAKKEVIYLAYRVPSCLMEASLRKKEQANGITTGDMWDHKVTLKAKCLVKDRYSG